MEDIYADSGEGVQEWGDEDDTPANDSDAETSNTSDDEEAVTSGDRLCDAEVTALCWSGGGVGVARYLCTECRIEVFEVPVHVVAGEAVRRRGAGGGGDCSSSSRSSYAEGTVRIVVHEDVPPSLLWLLRYLEVHQPQVLLPHQGSEALGDLAQLVSASVPLEVFRLSAATAFSASAALPRLAAMYPAQEAELASRFHTEKTAMMRAMAALLQFVAAGQSNVADVVERGVLHALYLEEACAEALQITRTERHPSAAQGRGRGKEGLSLRSLLSTGQSSLGRAMLRQWIALPCCDAVELEARQSVVAYFAHPEHHAVAQQLRTALHGVRATSHIFTAMRSGRAMRKHYVSLHRTICGVVQVHRLLSAVAHEVPRLYVLLHSITASPLAEMAAALARSVAGVAAKRSTMQSRVREGLPASVPSLSEAPESTCVRLCDGVDATLDELRLRLHELRLSLQSKAETAFAQLPWELRAGLSLRCAYAIPHGYLLCVPANELVSVVRPFLPPSVEEEEEEAASAPPPESGSEAESVGRYVAGREQEGPTHTPQTDAASAAAADSIAAVGEQACRFMADAFHWCFHHATQTGDYCFKSAAMEELDTWVGDLERRVQQREQQVRRELDTALLYGSLHLLRPTRALGELDCLLSFARVSAVEGWRRPQVIGPRCGAVHSPSEGCEEEESDGEAGVLEIENGWHPLLSRQLGLQQLIPFSLHLHTSTDRVCTVLGVNGSGKSVLMSAVAHIVFLAHVGCHVPAAAARMGLVDCIFAPSSSSSVVSVDTRASTSTAAAAAAAAAAWGGPSRLCAAIPRTGVACAAQAVAEPAQSSFYAECVALHRTLHHVTGQQRAAEAHEACLRGARQVLDNSVGRALVLLDDFGRGTAPVDACALLKGTLRYFAVGGQLGSGCGATEVTCRSKWPRAPLVLCATHLVEIFDVSPRSGLSTWNETSTGDPPLPMEWVKLYEMEAYTTYAPESTALSAADNGDVDDSENVAGAPTVVPRRVPLDVIPTFRPVCVTPQPGHQRWEAWARHASGHLDAGPALGRHCGLDAGLLARWTSALGVLHGGTSAHSES